MLLVLVFAKKKKNTGSGWCEGGAIILLQDTNKRCDVETIGYDDETVYCGCQ